MLTTIAVSGYRSLRDLVVPLGRLNVVTGANGSGKSSLYRALRLLAETAQGGVVAALAREGGFTSALWAGPEQFGRDVVAGREPVQGTVRDAPVALRLGFAGDEYGYAIDLGLPIPGNPGRTMFAQDPQIKREAIWNGPFLRQANLLVDRQAAMARARDGRSWRVVAQHLDPFESLFTQIADPERAPEVLSVRETMRRWRFYDHFRSDADAPARQPQAGTRTPVLAHDGRDLAAAWQTIREIGDHEALAEAVDDAFPRGVVDIVAESGRFMLWFRQHGLLRALSAAELSDGTLRYLLWIAALLTPRPPPLMVLNEPETSLHPDLLPALARLIRGAARVSQVWVVTHAQRLVDALELDEGCNTIVLEKRLGDTTVAGQGMLDAPAWHWPVR